MCSKIVFPIEFKNFELMAAAKDEPDSKSGNFIHID
tara:strand:+ start:12377 stop:12484 length:108 start_codon:yes stop_codon:yes gene_type:complete